jgi:hypothetical protein
LKDSSAFYTKITRAKMATYIKEERNILEEKEVTTENYRGQYKRDKGKGRK